MVGELKRGRHQYVKRVCENCGNGFNARKDRESNKHCSQACYWTYIEKRNTFCLTAYEAAIVDGILLSDGCISKGQKAKNYQLILTSVKRDYIEFVKSQLSFGTRVDKKKSHESVILGQKVKCKESFDLRTPSSPTFTKLRHEWYPDGKKKVPKNLRFSPVTVFHWYLGDGNLDNTKGITLCTECFDNDDLEYFIEGLKQIGVNAKINKRKRIEVPNNWVWEFLEYIGKCSVKSMAYKWDSIVTMSYWGRTCWECGGRFDTGVNHKQYCSDKCYQRNWQRRARDHAGRRASA